MTRRRAADRFARPRRWSVEVLEARRLLSGTASDDHGDDHGDHGERYVAPKVKPKKGKAPKLSPASQFDLALEAAAGGGTDLNEIEGNNTPAAATPITLGATNNVISGSIGSSGDHDYYSFTLTQRAGLFLDVDAKDTGLSSLDSLIRVYNSSANTTVIAENDDGDDFEQFALNDTTGTPHSDDASLYVDLNPGSYFVRVSASTLASTSTGAYQFKVRSDTNYTTTVPDFNSRRPDHSFPGGTFPDTLYLDFNGYSSSTDAWATRDIDPNTSGVQPNGPYTIAAFDLNNNPNEWTPGERAVIETVWRVVADDYAPFAINVSTVEPPSFDDGVAHRQVIGNSDGSQVRYGGSLGVAFRPSYTSGGANNNVAFTFASNFASYLGTGTEAAGTSGWIGAAAVEMGNTSSHEFGHALGLRHYGGPNNGQLNGIMHTPDFGLSRERWKVGLTSNAPDEGTPVTQDDVAVISNTTFGSTPNNTFGYASDDFGNTATAAGTMVLFEGALLQSGVIGQKTDVDYFRFDSRGMTTVSVSLLEHVANLDAELRLYNSAGTLLATSDPSTAITASITQDLPQGTYYAEVRSDGGDGEIGLYDLKVVSPATNPSRTPGAPGLWFTSDTGAYNTDRITSRNNSSAAQRLEFLVQSTTPGATVTLYKGGVVIGSAVATDNSVRIFTNGTSTLADGNHYFTTRQTEPGKFESPDSNPALVQIDTVKPTVDVIDVAPDPHPFPNTFVEVKFSRPVTGFGVDDISLTRGGVNVPLQSSNAPQSSDGQNFRVQFFADQTGSPGTYVMTVRASGSGIADTLAGNALENGASDAWTNNNVPPTIGSLSASPNPVAPGANLTLTATGVADANSGAGQQVSVTFYRESNGAPGLQVGSDLLWHTDYTSPYAVTFAAPGAGTYTYYAQAHDGSVTSDVVSTSVTVAVPVTAAPGSAPDLPAAYDTGLSDTDNVTAYHPAGPGGPLRFEVRNTIHNATVTIYLDGVTALASAQSVDGVAVVSLPSDTILPEGAHVYTARQTEGGKAESADSAPLTVTADYQGPVSDFAAVSPSPRTTAVPSLDITFDEPVYGFTLSDLQLERQLGDDYRQNVLTAAQALMTTDNRTFTLSNLAPVTEGEGGYWLRFAGAPLPPETALVDLAGNPIRHLDTEAWSNTNAAPRVTAVFVAGSAWTADFRDGLQAGGQGEAAYGYRIKPGEQTRTLGWSNLNQVSVRFSEAVNVEARHLVLNGVNVPEYLLAAADGFRYDAATRTATWTLRRAIPNDKVAMRLDADQETAGVADLSGKRLDGEWTNPVAPAVAGDTFPSGDNDAGGDFVFHLRVLPGDTTRDGAVNVFDHNVLRANLNLAAVGLAEGDLNGDGLVNVVDFNEYRAYLGRTTPA